MIEPVNALTPTDLNQINYQEATKFWGREITHLAPKQKILVIRLWKELQQRRQNKSED